MTLHTLTSQHNSCILTTDMLAFHVKEIKLAHNSFFSQCISLRNIKNRMLNICI